MVPDNILRQNRTLFTERHTLASSDLNFKAAGFFFLENHVQGFKVTQAITSHPNRIKFMHNSVTLQLLTFMPCYC